MERGGGNWGTQGLIALWLERDPGVLVLTPAHAWVLPGSVLPDGAHGSGRGLREQRIEPRLSPECELGLCPQLGSSSKAERAGALAHPDPARPQGESQRRSAGSGMELGRGGWGHSGTGRAEVPASPSRQPAHSSAHRALLRPLGRGRTGDAGDPGCRAGLLALPHKDCRSSMFVPSRGHPDTWYIS